MSGETAARKRRYSDIGSPFWRGGYATHGEAYKTKENNRDIFWTYGGMMRGESAARIKFLKELALECDFQKLTPDWRNTDGINYFSACRGDEQFLIFCRNTLAGKRIYPGNPITGKYHYKVEVFDAWECRKTDEYFIKTQTPFALKEWTVIKLTAAGDEKAGISLNEWETR